MSNNYADNLLQSMSIIAEQAVKNAGYDRTVQATIVSCVDPTIGKYKVNYQNGSWYAFSSNTNTTYVKGASVYVLIPGGDMNNTKTILGTTKQLGINYISTVEDIEKYALNGDSITTGGNFNLCSYKSETVVLYDTDTENPVSRLSININSANTYLKKSSHLVVSTLVRTNLPIEQRYNGNYGLNFYLVFAVATEGDTTQEVIRKYTFDVDNMEGNPYVLPNGLNQQASFEIDGANFKRISKIEMFVTDFPNPDSNAPNDEHPNDIFLSNISLFGANTLTQEELDGVALVLNAPKGYIFNSTKDEDTRTINAEVRVQGKTIDNKSQKLAYYWFVQDCTITSKSLFYCKYGGQGWKCLNKYKVIKDSLSYSFNAGPASFTITGNDVLVKQKKYKCVVVYDNTVISKQFIMINNSASFIIKIESDKDTEFVKDVGYPTLTCKVTNENNIQITSGLKYIWAQTTNTGTFNFLQDQTEIYNGSVINEKETKIEYGNALKKYNQLKKDLKNGTLLKNNNYEQNDIYKTQYYKENQNDIPTNLKIFNFLEKKLKILSKKQYVVNDEIKFLNVKNITNFSIFTCTVKDGENNVIGTASITIVNKATSSGGYSLIINNGSQVFNYDENGVSPSNKSQQKPLEIPALSFTLYDMNGREVDQDNIKSDDVEWIIPITNTMLEVSNGTVNTDQVTKTVKGKTLTYSIAQRYSINRTNNDIQLKIKYDNYTISNKTNFTFTKQGQLGTNGTGFVLKIVPCTDNDGKNELNDYPMATVIKNDKENVILNFKILKYQLWNNGEKLDGEATNVTWSILKNRGDYSCLSINKNNKNNGIITYNAKLKDKDNKNFLIDLLMNNTPLAHIVKLTVTYEKKTYYATLPIITIYRLKDTKYSASLVKNTGFRYVVYSEDGRFPQYDNHQPFTIKVTNIINNNEEDISLYTKKPNDPTYVFSYLGEYLKDDESKYLTGQNTNYSKDKNIKYIKPKDEYDGFSVINAVCCTVKINDVNQLFIHIPIHFMLNKFGHAALNKWDGNSIEISNEEGVILSPQVGAGKKDDSSNTFTGILIGDVKKGNDEPKTGLFGYGNGIQTIFLDANTGVAEFGKTGSGQIKIEPGDNNKTHATITGGNYIYDKTNGKGMQIDLSEPSIKFGSTNFYVTKDGYLYAKNGGQIAGWDIKEYALTKGKVGMSSDNQKIDKGKRVVDKDNNPVIDNDRIAFWAGDTTSTNAPFRVDFGGDLVANTATLGSGTKKITLGQSSSEYSAIYSNSKNSLSSTNSGFYLGTDGISLGSNFSVNQDGELTAKKGYIGSSISNGFTIAGKAIYNTKSIGYMDTTQNGIYLGKDGIGLGKGKFYVDYKGDLHAESGTIAGWKITSSSLSKDVPDKQYSYYIDKNITDKTKLNDPKNIYSTGIYFGDGGLRMGANFHINSNGDLWCNSGYFNGELHAESGEIAGWTINTNNLKAKNITISAEGSISGGVKDGNNWSIDSDGNAKFNAISITGGSMTGGNVGSGASIGKGGSGPSVYPGNCGWNGKSGKTLNDWFVNRLQAKKAYIKDLAADKINATYIIGKLAKAKIADVSSITATNIYGTNIYVQVAGDDNENQKVATQSWVNSKNFATTDNIPTIPTYSSAQGYLVKSVTYIQTKIGDEWVDIPYVTLTSNKHNFLYS